MAKVKAIPQGKGDCEKCHTMPNKPVADWKPHPGLDPSMKAFTCKCGGLRVFKVRKPEFPVP